MEHESWIEHAYPLQQVRIELQGTRHSDRAAIVEQLETVLARLRAGEDVGEEDDDDFGYRFRFTANARASVFAVPIALSPPPAGFGAGRRSD